MVVVVDRRRRGRGQETLAAAELAALHLEAHRVLFLAAATATGARLEARRHHDRRRHDRRGLRLLLYVLSLPLFAVCAVGALPIWLPYLLIMRGMKDKAWSLTVRFALHFLLPLFIPFDIGFQRLLNDYRELVADMR